MSDTISAIPADVAEHVSVDENGVITLSEEAQAALEDNAPPTPAEQPAEVQEQPQTQDAPVADATSRKIKWNGQEVEVKPEEEIPLLQKGYNYDQKMQQLEAERARLQAYNGLVSAIEASPDIRSKVQEALGYKQATNAAPEIPQFDDPIEQLKWETRQEVLREVEDRFIKPIQTQNEQSARQQALNAARITAQQDPQYSAVQAEIIRQIQAMPESIGRNLYAQIDQNPQLYMDMFHTVKKQIGSAPPTQNTQTAATETPQPTKRETKVPLLESTTDSNSAPISPEQQKMDDRIKELTKKSRQGDFRATGELMALLA